MVINAENLGLISQLVGSIGVVVTLIYLTIQLKLNTLSVKENTKLSRISEERALQEMMSRVRCLSLKEAELQVKQRLDSSELNSAEQLRLDLLWSEWLWATHTFYQQHSAGLVSGEIWKNSVPNIVRTLKSPRFTEWWTKHSSMFGEKFREEINRELQIS